MNGWKFLSPCGATEYNGEEFFYNMPALGEKWSRITWHPEPAEDPDGKDFGPGRLHVMKHFDAQYAPRNWWPWFCRGINVVGESAEKFSVQGLQLRRVSKKTFYYMLRRGYLREADLRWANLRGADLRWANLGWANLSGANLSKADLSDSNLSKAGLIDSNLSGADLYGANLREANLYGANLYGANLCGANLSKADLSGANLSGADLRWANLSRADLRWALYNEKQLENTHGQPIKR